MRSRVASASSFARSLILPVGLAAVCLLGGCTSRLAQYRANPSPAEDTLAQRHDDIDNAETIMADENFRMFNEDLGRALYWDRPSRLTPERIPW